MIPVLVSLLVNATVGVSTSGKAPRSEAISNDHLNGHFVQARDAVALYCGNDSIVLAQCDAFLQELKNAYLAGEGLIEKDVGRILEALCFAAKKHHHQTRKNKEQTPYIIHPIAVTHRLLTIGKVRDGEILMAGLLHDTVEDTQTTVEEIRACFGDRVAGFVKEVTDDKSLPKEERKRLQIETAPKKSSGAAQIKLADKLSNLTDMLDEPLLGWSEERRANYFAWARQVVEALPFVNASLKNAIDQTLNKRGA